MSRIVVVAGAGGVGKTTLSAALAVRAARAGIATLVLTVDPARRLADALGAASLGPVPEPASSVPGLDAAMLDASASWANVINRHASPEVAARLVDHEFFAALSDRFPSSQAYAAAEEMTGHAEAGRWDLILVDTPPAAGGVEFLTAPGSVAELIGGNALRWVTRPGSRLGSMAKRRALQLADNALGSDLLQRVTEFLTDLRTLYDGLAERAQDIEGVLADASTVLVTSARPTPLREVETFLDSELVASPAAIVFNRALPANWIDVMSDDPIMRQWSAEAARQHGVIASFAAPDGVPVELVSWRPDPPTDPDALAELVADIDLGAFA